MCGSKKRQFSPSWRRLGASVDGHPSSRDSYKKLQSIWTLGISRTCATWKRSFKGGVVFIISAFISVNAFGSSFFPPRALGHSTQVKSGLLETVGWWWWWFCEQFVCVFVRPLPATLRVPFWLCAKVRTRPLLYLRNITVKLAFCQRWHHGWCCWGLSVDEETYKRITGVKAWKW